MVRWWRQRRAHAWTTEVLLTRSKFYWRNGCFIFSFELHTHAHHIHTCITYLVPGEDRSHVSWLQVGVFNHWTIFSAESRQQPGRQRGSDWRKESPRDTGPNRLHTAQTACWSPEHHMWTYSYWIYVTADGAQRPQLSKLISDVWRFSTADNKLFSVWVYTRHWLSLSSGLHPSEEHLKSVPVWRLLQRMHSYDPSWPHISQDSLCARKRREKNRTWRHRVM